MLIQPCSHSLKNMFRIKPGGPCPPATPSCPGYPGSPVSPGGPGHPGSPWGPGIIANIPDLPISLIN